MRESGFKEGGGAGGRGRRGIGKIDHRVEKKKTLLKILSRREEATGSQVKSRLRDTQVKNADRSEITARNQPRNQPPLYCLRVRFWSHPPEEAFIQTSLPSL